MLRIGSEHLMRPQELLIGGDAREGEECVFWSEEGDELAGRSRERRRARDRAAAGDFGTLGGGADVPGEVGDGSQRREQVIGERSGREPVEVDGRLDRKFADAFTDEGRHDGP